MVDPATIIFSAVGAIKNAFDIADKMDKQIEATNDQELVKNAMQLQKALFQIEKEQHKLERKIEELAKENEELKKKTSQGNSFFSVPPKISLNEKELTIIKFLYDKPEGRITLAMICAECGLDEPRAKYHTKKLDDADLIYISVVMSMAGRSPPNYYSITAEGRAYLIENNLV